ncbi:TetR/AcrR family transcriptional regulator [Belliella marina]|uniref:TetR/AcrR family transcriptional regulator n=1 Tax=Belliella marina TaxID=1644146 RepID=A0ABW4VLJ6_9BACT
MGSAERKAKEKEELKKLILQAAKKLFAEKGIEQTTIRNIASAIEYSVGTVYVYFKDKKEILHELHSQGFRHLGGEMRVLFNVSDPLERLKALGRVYLKFAVENPDMYELMFHMREPMECLESLHEGVWSEGKATFDVLRSTVNQCIEEGHFKGHQLEPLAFIFWSTVHGMASLHIGQRINRVDLKEPETMLSSAYDEFILMMDNS